MAITAGTIFHIVAIFFRLFASTNPTLRCPLGFAIGAASAVALCIELLASKMRTGAKLTGLRLLTYLLAVSTSTVLGGTVFLAGCQPLPVQDFGHAKAIYPLASGG